jgi:hypothetical protein
MLSVDDRAAEARGFFDLEAAVAPSFPPPPPAFPTSAIPAHLSPAGLPQLPRNTPAVPSFVPDTPVNFFPEALFPSPAAAARRTKGPSSARRFFSWMIMLGLVGGAVFAGVTYGPDLLARAQGETTIDEPAAPLAFPPVMALAAPARTGSFVIERPADNGSVVRYEVTNDFETGVSRMVVDRATTPDIEVLAVFDVANLRQVDEPTWYSMPRGEFPFAGGSERQRWIRTVDDYFPASIRRFVTIDRATESILGTETVRHLVVTVDAAGIANSATAIVTDPLTGLQIPAAPPAPGQFQLPPNLTGSTSAILPVTIEMWVDSTGVIRKLAEPAELGGITTTVVSMTDGAFMPAFPAPETTVALTAGQMADLAL